MPLPTLKGHRVRLRWLQLDDAADVYRIFSDARVVRYWSSTRFESEAKAVALIEEIHRYFEAGTLYQWGIADQEDRIIGTCTLAGIDRDNGRAEIGFALTSERWGEGLASEAVALLLRHAFEELGLHRIEADVDPLNDRSLSLLERIGFRKEGYLRERWRVGGGVQDSILLGLLRREWVHWPTG